MIGEEPRDVPAPASHEGRPVVPPPPGMPDVGAPAPTPPAEVATPYGLVPSQPSSSAAALLAVSTDGARLVATPQPDRVTADGYLRMTARVLIESPGEASRVVGVVSAHEGEGRTAAAVNLAVCLGRAKGRRGRVLLVDGDARRRGLTRLFCGTGPVAGPDGAPVPHPTLIGTALEGVDLMTAPDLDDGLTVSTPAAWVHTFRELGALYPHLVVDCPAVLDDPEGLVLRECVERIVLVVKAGETTRTAVTRTLGSLSGRVLGVIVQGAHAADGGWR